MPDKNNTEPQHTTQNFPIVGVGASAGGLDAFKKLVRNIALDSGMAYVLVQHLTPLKHSSLSEILEKETTLPVHLITDEINLAPNHIYIIPENKMLTTFDGKLKLDPRLEGDKLNMVIDLFFNSLAEVHNEFSRGVILSGTGFDGTQGLKTIKEKGGVTIVQSPDTASFDAMPQNAIKAGAADFVVDVEDIPAQLQDIDYAYETNHAYAGENDALPKSDEEVFKHVLRLLRIKTGNDFSHYKQPTIRRRIARRMVMTKKEEPADYLNFLRNDAKELDALFNDILIPVSYFFRDSDIFDSLKDSVFPLILEKISANDNIRVWVAGCSTGEEAYSIAISIHEYLTENNIDIKVQIFASDISENVINKARSAVYTREELQNVSESRLKNYFNKKDGAYHVNKEIRDMCIFAVHNFVKDPPFARMDLITCRNVLIYLGPFLQKKSLNTFHYALKPHGMLFLGKSESVGHAPNLFEPLVKSSKIFSRKSATSHFVPASFERTENIISPNKSQTARKKAGMEPDFQKIASDILFTKYTPAGVIINEQKEIVHFHGDTGDFLAPAPGRANFNIFKMVREGLAFELRNAIVKAKASNSMVAKDSIILKSQGYMVNIEVIPLPNTAEPHYLVVFNKCSLPDDEKTRATQRKNADQQRIAMLEAEIEQMRDDIRRVTEDQEAANEELQSANEELLSNSEELQTLNEEMETSAEELQSNNEELNSVNDELMDRQEQLVMTRMYSEAIIETVRESLIVLDKDMRVKSANASYYRYFGTTEQETEGKVLFDLGSGQWNIPGLRSEFESIHQHKNKLDNYEIKAQFPGMGERVMLLNVRPIVNDSITDQLILVAIDDITEIRAANALLIENNRNLEENNKELTSFSYIASHDLQEPLRKIFTFSKLITDNESDTISDTTKKYLDRIKVSAVRMQQLIGDLLDYSRINNLDVNFEEMDITSIIDEVTIEINETIENKGASIEVDKMPVMKILPTLVRQLFINLLGNALKYSKADTSPVIRITSTIVPGRETVLLGGDENTSYHKIMVSDNGIGFLQEQAKRIFEPFQRLHAKDKYEGTGIGLAICKKIILKHKGFITAESSPGAGSTFNLYFPVE